MIERTDNDNSGIYPEFNSIEQQKLKNNLGWHKFSFSWLRMTLFVCQFVAVQDFSVREKLRVFNRSLQSNFELLVKASRKLKGFTWIDGKKVPFDKFGGVPLKNAK
ncbi:MAG: hypothetical protein QNJ74_19525 [Trichodesmium sp. MO_231.B1]|nr:hypothetical protein [Trichodesmium sp. MO_231.B1]